jgi:hypothetical protein
MLASFFALLLGTEQLMQREYRPTIRSGYSTTDYLTAR